MTHERRALEDVVRAAQNSVERLMDALGRPEVSMVGLARSCLEITLASVAAAVADLRDDPSIPADTRKAFRSFVEAFRTYERATADVRQHLEALAVEWKCRDCRTKTAKNAAISGVRAGSLRVDLICEACGRASPLTAGGRRAFDALFGPLVSVAWDPTKNGFIWDGR